MSSRTVEVIKAGVIGLETAYPGKLVVRLRDLTKLYSGEALRGLAAGKAAAERYKIGHILENPPMPPSEYLPEGYAGEKYYEPNFEQVEPALTSLASAIEDLYDRMRGVRLSGINVEVWDQISGAYLGSRNTDEHGTLILPTDAEFCEVLQWKLAGGGYSDCFNGERAAGTPGMFAYFPCSEGSGAQIASFPGVSGQQAAWDGGWYDTGFFNRPALKIATAGQKVSAQGGEPEGRNGFQFLWYCADPRNDNGIFSFSALGLGASADFNLAISSGALQGTLAGGASQAGTTILQADTWYLVQINTRMFGRWNPTGGLYGCGAFEYQIEMDVYLGGTLELTVSSSGFVAASALTLSNAAFFGGAERDGLDEIRIFARELYSGEITNYALFLKNGRYPGQSDGKVGNPGW